MIDAKYVFPNFNILLYAENHIFPAASAQASNSETKTSNPEESKVIELKEGNREELYNLYYKALNLEPEPKHPELTFTQRMLVNKARSFITKRMKKRAALR